MSYIFSTIEPTQNLKPFVKFFFTVEFKNDDVGTDYLLPNGLPSFFYSQAESPVQMYFGKNEKPSLLENGFYVGYCDTVIRFTHEHARMVGAIVYPIYFSLLFGKSLQEIMNQFKRVKEPPLLGRVSSLINRPAEYTKLFQLFEEYFTHQLNNHPLRDDFSKIYHRLTEAGGYHLRVDELAESLGYSTRYLHAQFRQHFGMSPKQFIKMVKFNHALKYMYDSEGERSLASIAYEVGYHDQSHFIRDFKSICGKTPKELMGNSASLAREFRLF
jgi:AraC-like DNA-binding protein